jgi:hypothetical protein
MHFASFFPVSSMHALDSSAGDAAPPRRGPGLAKGSFSCNVLVRGDRFMADWERMLDVTLLSVAVLLFGAGFYWLVRA